MRVFVTGAAGFIGSRVARLLVRKGHTVYGVIREDDSKEPVMDFIDRLHVVPVGLEDVTDVRAMVSDIRPECAIHLAWYTVPGKYWTAPENLDCVAMGLSLVQALAESGCKRFVAAGSCAEYDWDYGFLSEDITPTKPRTLYGICKNALRDILQAYCEHKSIEFAWTRFFFLYGPNEQKERLVPSVTLALLRGETAKCTHGEQIRDFLHVEDVASAVCAVAESTLTGPVNIGSGQPVKIRTIVETIAHILGRTEGIAFGALPIDPAEPPFLVADVRRLKTKTNWKPLFTLDTGIDNTVSWWRRKEKL